MLSFFVYFFLMNIALSFIVTIIATMILIPITTLLSAVMLIPIYMLLAVIKLKNEITTRYISRAVISFICWCIFSYLIETFSFNSNIVSLTFLTVWGYTEYTYSKIQSNRYFLFEVLKGDLKKYNIHAFFIIILSIIMYYAWNFLILYFTLK